MRLTSDWSFRDVATSIASFLECNEEQAAYRTCRGLGPSTNEGEKFAPAVLILCLALPPPRRNALAGVDAARSRAGVDSIEGGRAIKEGRSEPSSVTSPLPLGMRKQPPWRTHFRRGSERPTIDAPGQIGQVGVVGLGKSHPQANTGTSHIGASVTSARCALRTLPWPRDVGRGVAPPHSLEAQSLPA